jgi:hypothetical protein
LHRLLSLSIDAYNSDGHSNNIYQLVFALPYLKSNKLILDEDDSSISLPIATDQQTSSIEYFIIDHSCTFEEIFILLSYTPHIRCLKFSITNNIDRTIQRLLPMKLSNLTHISMEICCVPPTKKIFGENRC